MNSEFIHRSVLLEEVIRFLDLREGDKIIDATINGGGHSKKILEIVGDSGSLLGIELDPELYNLAKRLFLQSYNSRIKLVNDNFAEIDRIAEENDFNEANGVLFDFGVSSFHFDQSGRGFTFQKDEPLDMRISSNGFLSAREIINIYSEEELYKVLKDYGEEGFAKSIAANIVQQRKKKLIESTKELSALIEKSVPDWYRHQKINPATKTFQALRIAVNQELKNIDQGLNGAIRILARGGKIIAISFHGLEDKIVKEKFREWEKEGLGKVLTKKPIVPLSNEILINVRSRSAKMRVFQKISILA